MDRLREFEGIAARLSRFWPVVLAAAGLALYAVGLRGPYFSDDYDFYFDPAPSSVFYYFLHVHGTGFYRPIQATVLLVIQKYFGLETLPIHLLQLALHVTLAVLVYRWMLSKGTGILAAALGSLLLVLSQAAVEGVEGNDTLSQVGCALFGWSGIWAISEGLDSETTSVFAKRIALGLGLFSLAFFSKESAAGFVVLAVAVCAWKVLRGRQCTIRAVVTVTSVLAVFTAYWLIRSHIGASSAHIGSGGRYNFKLGLNVIVNLLQFLVAAALPYSTATAFLAVAARNVVGIAMAAASVIAVLAAVAAGVLKLPSPQRAIARGLLIAAVLGLVPALFLNTVSELYGYNALPPLAALAGIGLARMMSFAPRSRIGAASVVLVLLGNAGGSWVKIRAMAANGRKEDVLLAKITAFRAQIPRGGSVILVNPPPTGPNYSVIVQHDFNLLGDSEPRIAYLLGLPPRHVRIADRDYGAGAPLAAASDLKLTVTPDETDVHRMP